MNWRKIYTSKRGFECLSCLSWKRPGAFFVRVYFPKDSDGKRYTAKCCTDCTDYGSTRNPTSLLHNDFKWAETQRVMGVK